MTAAEFSILWLCAGLVYVSLALCFREGEFRQAFDRTSPARQLGAVTAAVAIVVVFWPLPVFQLAREWIKNAP